MKIIEYRLGRSITQLVQFYKPKQGQLKQDPVINNKLVITMMVVALAKIVILILL